MKALESTGLSPQHHQPSSPLLDERCVAASPRGAIADALGYDRQPVGSALPRRAPRRQGLIAPQARSPRTGGATWWKLTPRAGAAKALGELRR